MTEIGDPPSPQAFGGWTRQRIVFLTISGALLVALLVSVRQVLLPFLLGIIIAYVLTPLVQVGESRLRLPRSVSILLVYVLVLGTVVLSVSAIAPRIVDETVRFAGEVPALARRVARRQGPRIEKWVNAYQNSASEKKSEKKREPSLNIHKSGEDYSVDVGSGLSIVEEGDGHWRVIPDHELDTKDFQVSAVVDEGVETVINYVQINALQLLKFGQTILTGLSRGVLLLFMTLMVAGYIMHTREDIFHFFRSLSPRIYRPGFDLLLKRVDRGLSGVVRGQLVICVVNGVLSAIGFAIFDLKYGPVLALLAAVMSIIPIFGSILSTVPAVLVGLTQDAWIALWVLLWILGIHQVEANFLNPKIIGVSARLHPVLVVFSLLVGEHYFGLWGALFAVPVLSIAQSLFNHFRFSLPDCEPDSLSP